MTTTAGAWTPPSPGTTTSPPSHIQPFSPGYTYGDLANLHLPIFSNTATSTSTAPYTNRTSSSAAPAFVLHDPDLDSDLAQWFEVMMNSTPDGRSLPTAVNPIIRFRPTPPACAHCWDAIVTHAMTPCRNEGWVESYATNIVSLISCLMQGIWPTLRLAEWPVDPLHSQQGDRHITVATIMNYADGSRRAAALFAIAGEWKTETVVEKHRTLMVTDHALPPREAENEDAILKKVLGLHIYSARVQCTERNDALNSHPQKPANVNVQYGIVFTGQTCLVGQLVIGPTPPDYAPFLGMAISSICIASNPHSREEPQSFIALMLGIVWGYSKVEVVRDLAGLNGQVDRLYEDYLAIYPSLQSRLKKRTGTSGSVMPFPPPQPPGRGPPGPPSSGPGHRPTRNAPGGYYPTGGAGSSSGTGRAYYPPAANTLLHSYLPTEPGRSLPVIRTPRTDWAAPNPYLSSPPLDLTVTAFTNSFSIVDLALALSNPGAARLSHTSSTAIYLAGEYTFIIREIDVYAELARLAIIIPALYAVLYKQSQSSVGLLVNATDSDPPTRNPKSHKGWANVFVKVPQRVLTEVDSAVNIHSGISSTRGVHRPRGGLCLCVVDFGQATLHCEIF
ncbi:hypothetical protein B0H13DRAFT_2659779 [Mycena leptocephala]|nr:hypothetical protein B0H13DRAFT_2659779 [Mycena leptocephala]